MMRPAPACRAAAADRLPLLPAAPRIATTGPRAGRLAPGCWRSGPPSGCSLFAPEPFAAEPEAASLRAASATTRPVRAGAPQTSSTASASGAGRSSGIWAAIERPNKIACPSHGTCSDRPSQEARPSVSSSGVRLSETSVAMTSPGFSPSGDCSPTSATTPVSIPPEPVTGFCILPRLLTISSTADFIAAGSPPVASRSWRKDAASRLSRWTRTRTSSGQSCGLGSSRQAACGSTPAGSSTRCRPSGDPARAGGLGMLIVFGSLSYLNDSVEFPVLYYTVRSFLRNLP